MNKNKSPDSKALHINLLVNIIQKFQKCVRITETSAKIVRLRL